MQVVIGVTVIVMACAELLAHVSSGLLHVLPVPVAAILVTAFARRRGITWAELGLARSTWGRGAAYGLAVIGLVVVVVALAAAIPWTRTAFTDDRYDFGIGHGLVVALIYIPLRTVIAEELVFRGVLLAALRRLYVTRVAVIVSSILFGLWHVVSSLNLAQDNEAVASPLGSGSLGQLVGVVGSVVVTTVAGLLFCWLRLRSGSLLASIAAHWAVNGVGVLASATVWTLTN
jgi:CAAX protease family protein